MNFETSRWRRSAIDGDVLDDDGFARRRRRRRALVVAGVVVLLAVIGAIFLFGKGEEPAAATAQEAQALPTVTVMVPGSHQVARTINATGSLAARRDMPVGVAGEGGMVARVLVDAGDWVSAGQTLAVIERSVQAQQAQQLAAQIDVARADAALAQSELDRAQSLVARGFVSKADIDRKTATRDAARARVRVAQAQLAETRARIGRLDIRAPEAGLVLARMVEPGQVVAGSAPLFRIAKGGEMELLARLSQEDIARIKVGTPAKVTPVGSSESVQGSVWLVSPVIDPQTRQGDARIAIPYRNALRPGGFASAELIAGAVDAPLLPESAVLSADGSNYVYVVDAKNMVVKKPVKVGDVSDAGITIVSGLTGAEQVVVSAGAFLNPGDKVIPKKVAAR